MYSNQGNLDDICKAIEAMEAAGLAEASQEARIKLSQFQSEHLKDAFQAALAEVRIL